MKKLQLLILNCLIIVLSSCDSFLDIVPDDIATIDNAFTMRAQAEKYLFTCYYYLPAHGLLEANPAIAGGDELYITESFRSAAHVHAWYISHNMQSSARPRCDYWTGADQQNNKSLYQGISDCNIFLENIQKVPDMTQAEKDRWAAEVRFLKAYYHYWLIRMYGPIPIMDQNIPVNAGEEEVKVFRNTIDECFDYVINTLTEIIDSNHLPDKIMNEAEELGRITQGIAMAIRAEVMVTAASPLFNGNADYKGYTDSRGIEIFNPNKSEQDKKQRWIDAAEACKQAIEFLKAQGHDLYKYTSLEYTISDQTRAKMNIRNIVTEKWNQEIIWANSNSIIGQLQDHAIPRGLEPGKEGNASVGGNLAVPLKIADLFYTKNGVPITEDKTWNYADRFKVKMHTNEQPYELASYYETIQMNFDREPRFYANIGFDGCTWYQYNCPSDSEKDIWTAKNRAGQAQGKLGTNSYTTTGYWTKKLVSVTYEVTQSGYTTERFPWPEMRLTDLYLLYAEALNEKDDVNNRELAISYLDQIRARAGLKGIKESWDTYSKYPNRYKTQEGLREIIQRERAIELMFEGSRFWDLRRWKTANKVLNEKIHGWNFEGETPAEYYSQRTLYTLKFIAPRDYFWPIHQNDLVVNPKLVQNPGW